MLTEGQFVKAEHKTGQYIGKIASVDERRALVEIMAVLRHPQQGDLHSAYDPDAALFHERRASAEREKVWVMLRDAVPYAGGGARLPGIARRGMGSRGSQNGPDAALGGAVSAVSGYARDRLRSRPMIRGGVSAGAHSSRNVHRE
ncbi:sporulation phosphorelay system protein KapB [Cohnella rhizosphaerae]|uniref:sporulation phosphorelay system protein KapB n=1 Tax=Cohnella rhizosphaerae TaxID=1457232 RepID=UPI0030B86F9C